MKNILKKLWVWLSSEQITNSYEEELGRAWSKSPNNGVTRTTRGPSGVVPHSITKE